MKGLLQILRFGCVGTTAALVHFAVVSLIVPHGIPPLWANIIAFAIAWQVSYYGHRTVTFQTRGGMRAYRRMLVTSLGSFALQELLYAVMLRITSFDYRVSLVIVLLIAASGTFLASRFWVFTPKETP